MDSNIEASGEVRILLPPRRMHITTPLPVQRYNSFLSLVQHTNLTATASKRIVDDVDSQDLGWIQYNPRGYLEYLKDREDDFVIGAASERERFAESGLVFA